MACLTLAPQDLFNIAGVMSINLPQVYYSRVRTINSNITMLIQNQVISSSLSYKYNFPTSGGVPFTYFAKSPGANVDLYESIISPYYNDGMILQTWGRPYEQNFCPPSYNYPNSNLLEVKAGTYWWTGYYDHSKWGVPTSAKVVCYGDMNRMNTQRARGGGALCIANSNIYDIHFGVITNMDPCGTP